MRPFPMRSLILSYRSNSTLMQSIVTPQIEAIGESLRSVMTHIKSKSVRFQDDIEASKFKQNDKIMRAYSSIDGTQKFGQGRKVFPQKTHKICKAKVLSRVFSEDYNFLNTKQRFLDPRGTVIHRWNKIFLVACLLSLFVDPLFFYLPDTHEIECISVGAPLEIVLTIIRSIIDIMYIIQIFVRSRTAYVAPSSRVFGRGELVVDPSKIVRRYLFGGFWLDLIAALPVPQFLIWVLLPSLKGSTMTNMKIAIRFCIIFQYIPRLFLIYPLSSQIVKTSGVVTETAWAGAAYNLVLYMLASHVIGATWYLLSLERQQSCWRHVCRLEPSCQYEYFDCRSIGTSRNLWFQTSNLTDFCDPNNNFFKFGIYADAMINKITSSPFLQKYFFCLWWGLNNLSSLGQNLQTSTNIGETSFAILIAVFGLVLFGFLIGNVQSYLQSTMARIEEWRIRRTDTERWMKHRQLPTELRQFVRQYDQYRWLATRGVDEEELLRGLPLDLRRDIKRHLCLDLVRRVPLFDQMDERMLDAICERLRPVLYTNGTFLVRELDPVTEMIFIIRGHLDSYTTNGGRTGFFNTCRIGPGDFCGEELLTWALDPRPTANLPSSTRTVCAVSDVEAFALVSDDLKFVASQFRRLHSKQLRHKFRFYSHQWRAWAACFIQAAWRRHRRQRASAEPRLLAEASAVKVMESQSAPAPGSGAAVFVAKVVASKKGGHDPGGENASIIKPLQKPKEPDFSMEESDFSMEEES